MSHLLIVLFDVLQSTGFGNSRHLSLLFLLDTEFNLNKDILSQNNVPLEKPKCTPRGTCTPVWEPLPYNKQIKGNLNCLLLNLNLFMQDYTIFITFKF